jgi:hypothetical protein
MKRFLSPPCCQGVFRGCASEHFDYLAELRAE